jgi:hypothetical protein
MKKNVLDFHKPVQVDIIFQLCEIDNRHILP